MNAASHLVVEGHVDTVTSTISYIVLDRTTQQCAIVDSVLDYDPKSGRTATDAADALMRRVRELGATVQWHLETHVHADHLSGAHYLKAQLGGEIGIGDQIRTVQTVFGKIFNADARFARDGSQFDHLFHDGDTFKIGSLDARVLHTPGHTPACLTYVVSDEHETVAFVGDTLFMPDYGTARADFPGGDARQLYRSIRRLLDLPPQTRLFMCHDYPPGGRAPDWETTVAAERAGNLMVRDGISEDEFVRRREARDATLAAPVLILPSLQVNIRAGRLPEPAANDVRYLRIPLNRLPCREHAEAAGKP